MVLSIKIISKVPPTGNPYVLVLEDSINKFYKKECKIVPYDHKKDVFENLREQADIYHIQWPEFLILPLHIKNSAFLKNRLGYIKQLFKLILILQLKKFKSKKILLHVHNFWPHEKRLKEYYLFLTVLYLISNKIVVMSQQQKIEAESMYLLKNKKIEILHHPNYVRYYKNTVTKSRARKKLKLPQNRFIFGYFGLIRPYKGVEDLFKAFSNLKTNDALLVCGRWSDINYKEKLINNYCKGNKNIVIVDIFIKDSYVQYYLNAMDIVAFTYKNIANSGSAFLALSFFKPIIIPFKGSLKELYSKDEPFSMVYRSNHEFIQRLKEAKKIDLVEYSKNAKKFISRYDHKRVAKELFEIYKFS